MKIKRWIVVLALVVLIPLCAYALLFEFNRFDLVIRVEGSQYMELPENEQYVEPGVEIRWVPDFSGRAFR